MKRKLSILALCLCFIVPNAGAQPLEPAIAPSSADLLPVAVILHSGSGETSVKTILLIVVNQSTGKALKATLKPDLFLCGAFDAQNADSVYRLLKSIEEGLQLPLEKYVCLEANAFESTKAGEAKGKSVWDLIGLGFSVLGSIETNLPASQAVTTFQRVFAQKDEGIEIMLPDDAVDPASTLAEPDWNAMRKVLYDAMKEIL